MLSAGESFRNPRSGAELEVLRVPSGGADGVLEVRRRVKPGTGRTLPHVHGDYVERFVVESGRASAKVDGRRVALGPGAELAVPVGARHVNAHNDGDEDLVMVHSFEPASDFVLGYVETLGHMMRAGRTDRQGELPASATFAIGDATATRTFAAGPPKGLQRSLLLPLGTRLARLRGYELRLPS